MKSNIKELYIKKIGKILQEYGINENSDNAFLSIDKTTQRAIFKSLNQNFALSLNIDEVVCFPVTLNDIVEIVMENLPLPDIEPGEIKLLLDLKQI